MARFFLFFLFPFRSNSGIPLFKLQKRWGPEARRGRARMAARTRGEAARRPRLARPRRRPVSRRSQRSTPTSEWTPTEATRQPLTLANSATARFPGLAISRSTNRYPRLLHYPLFSPFPSLLFSFFPPFIDTVRERSVEGLTPRVYIFHFVSSLMEIDPNVILWRKFAFPSFYFFRIFREFLIYSKEMKSWLIRFDLSSSSFHPIIYMYI